MLKCITCNDIFRSHSELNYHVRRDDQSLVKVKFQNGSIIEVKRDEDDTFKCQCEKGFKCPSSFKRHAKGCSGKAMESYKGREEDIQMSREGSDALESAEYDDEEEINDTPPDCFGTLYSHEMG